MHFGSLIAAVASFLEARSHGGKWLIRIEDIDPPREVPGSAQHILTDLAMLGMHSDDEVLYQSSRMQAFEHATKRLIEQGDAYWCGCSRSELPSSGIYPGTCRNGISPGKRARSVRIKTNGCSVNFLDRIQGDHSQDLEHEVGDFVIRRADGLPAYQLAVVLDDAFQSVTNVVRGADLLDSTPRQIHLQKRLGLTVPQYAHVPVALNQHGAKLSKRLKSDPVSRNTPQAVIHAALAFLGQEPPHDSTLEALWDWALEHWDIERVPKSPGMAFQSEA